MHTIICDKTGISFESDSKRTKNHPQATAFLDNANKDGRHYVGAYGAASDILEQVKTADFASIDEAISAAKEAYETWKTTRANPIIRKTAGDYLRESKKRNETNALLRAHGYLWHKEDEESMDMFGATAFESIYGNASEVWVLTAPDGRAVSVSQALVEIEAKKND